MLFVFSMIDDFFAEPLEPTVNVGERKARNRNEKVRRKKGKKSKTREVVQEKLFCQC